MRARNVLIAALFAAGFCAPALAQQSAAAAPAAAPAAPPACQQGRGAAMAESKLAPIPGTEANMSAALYGVPDADIRALAHLLAHSP